MTHHYQDVFCRQGAIRSLSDCYRMKWRMLNPFSPCSPNRTLRIIRYRTHVIRFKLTLKRTFSGCSISQNSASVIFRGYLKFASEMFRGYLNYTSKTPISTSVIFRGYLNSASVILIFPRNYRGFRPLCYTLLFLILLH